MLKSGVGLLSARVPRAWVALCAASLVVLACGRKTPRPPPGRDWNPRDWELMDGTILSLPVLGDFPRIGLQWTYALRAEGYASDTPLPARVAFRVTDRDQLGHPWAGWWLYERTPVGEQTGFTIRPREVFFHPPRCLVMRELQFAPWPIARPGRPGERRHTLAIGEGWGTDAGRTIEKRMRDIGRQAVEVPAGRFAEAWFVEGESPDWTGQFWWVERVGFVRMVFRNQDGRSIELALLDVRQVDR
jgi:hypothetical protein